MFWAEKEKIKHSSFRIQLWTYQINKIFSSKRKNEIIFSDMVPPLSF